MANTNKRRSKNDSIEALLCAVDEHRNNFTRLNKELNKFLKKGIETNDIALIGCATYYLALSDYKQGHRTSFLANAYKAATMLEGTEEYTMVARGFNLLGIAYGAQENFPLALDSYNRALQVIRSHKSCRLKRDSVQNNIAECYYYMGEYRRSISITLECLRAARKYTPDNHEGIAIYGLNLSAYYEKVEEYDKAWAILDDVAADAEGIEELTTVSAFNSRRACVAYSLGDAETGAKYADMLFEAVASGVDTYENHSDFAQISRDELKAGDFERAKRFADILKDYAKTSGHTVDEIIAVRSEADYYLAVGDKERALELSFALNDLYQKRIMEVRSMQYAFQRRVIRTDREVKKLLEKVRVTEQIAEKDPLTQLLNRTALISVANEFIHAARAKSCMLGGIFIDIDFFKEYNDTYGHAKGDEVIKQVAAACLAEESQSVRFARYGGDEFLGLILNEKNGDIGKLAARICARLRANGIEHIKNPNGQRVTVSVGVVNVDMADNDNTIIDVINRADKALYHAKDSGRDSIFLFDYSEESGTLYRRLEY